MEPTGNANPQPPKDVLLPYQIRWMADESPIKVAEKSRRIGLTWTEAGASALAASTSRGMDTWYLGYNQDMAREFVETAAAWARQFNKAARAIEEVAIDDERRDLLAYRIRFSSGHKIVALSSRPSNLRGKQGRAVIDEAAFHDDLKGLLKAALAFTMWGGCVRVMSTHNGANSAFNELVNDIRAGRKPYSLHRVTFDDAIAGGLYHRICSKLGRKWSSAGEADWRAQIFAEYGEDADEELLCIPRSSGGAYLSSVLIEGRMRAGVPVIRWELPEDFARRPESERTRAAREFCDEQIGPHLHALDGASMSFLGEDFGRSGDLTVIWPLQLKGNITRRTPFVIEMRNVPFRQQEQVLFYVADRLPNFVAGAMDARGNGQYLAETAMQRYGGRIQQVMLSNEWYRDHMPRYKAAFEDGLIELPLDAEILADHRALVMEDGVVRIPDRRNTGGASGKRRHGDAAIAGALAYFASQAQVGEISYQPAPRERLFETAASTEMRPRPEPEPSIRSARRGRFGLPAGTW
jgi:phage FluMu gp28-like protein